MGCPSCRWGDGASAMGMPLTAMCPAGMGPPSVSVNMTQLAPSARHAAPFTVTGPGRGQHQAMPTSVLVSDGP